MVSFDVTVTPIHWLLMIITLEKNHGLMLGYCDDYEHRFNVLPTLSSIIEEQHITQDIRRHIIRAIDNLTTSGENHIYAQST